MQVKTPERDGYSAVQVTFGDKDARKLTKPELGPLREGRRRRRRARSSSCASTTSRGYEVGQVIAADMLAAGELVDVTAVSKGKGFAGVMKRHNFTGQRARHGTHQKHRAPGSIGACATPARVFKGIRMAGRMGGEQGHHAEPRGRRGRRRARPAARQGRGARPQRRRSSSSATR